MVLPKYPKLWLTKLNEMTPSIWLFHGLQENLREGAYCKCYPFFLVIVAA